MEQSTYASACVVWIEIQRLKRVYAETLRDSSHIRVDSNCCRINFLNFKQGGGWINLSRSVVLERNNEYVDLKAGLGTVIAFAGPCSAEQPIRL
jgi:hypothetical protein